MTLVPAQEWWTAAEIAAARLPGLPATKRAVNAVAERDNWAGQPGGVRRRKGRGGGLEYSWILFPLTTQKHLLAQVRAAAVVVPDARPDRDAAWTWFEGLPDTVKAEAQRRLDVIQRAETLRDAGTTLYLAIIEAARSAGVAPRSVWNWLARIDGVRTDDRLAYLAPQHRSDRRSSRRLEIDPRFADLIKADWLRLSQPSLTSVYDRSCRIAAQQGIPTVPLQVVRRWLDRTVSVAAKTLARKGTEALKRLQPAQERDKTALHAMQAVNADFHRFDVFVRFPAGPGGQKEEIARPQMVAMQDVYSGKIVSWRLDRVPNSQAVQLCIGEMIETWGIPDQVLMDNGREFAAKLITGGVPTRYRFKVRQDDMTGLLVTLGCTVHWANPYSGQSKPIERAFRDLCDRVAKHPAFEGAYTGNRPDAKPENYGARAVGLDEFLAVLRDELAQHNSREDRRSEVAYGRSFDQVFAESYATAPIRRATEAQRRLWLMGAEGVRANGRTGQISFFGNRYWAPWMNAIAGEPVVVRFDRAALWDGLHVYGRSDQYLGHAPCLVKTGFFDVDDARSTARARADYAKAARAELAAHRRLSPKEVAAALRQLPPIDAPRPQPSVIRPVFARPVRPSVDPRPPSAEDIAAQQAIVTDLDQRRAQQASDAGKEAFARARDIEQRLTAGLPVTKEQQVWLAGYQQTAEYRSWSKMIEDFGESILAR